MLTSLADRTLALATALALGGAIAAQTAEVLQNTLIRAEFGDRGLVAIHNLAAQKTLGFTHDGTALFLGDEEVDTEFQQPVLESSTATNRAYRLQSGRWTAHIIYDLQPEWHFLTKRVEVTADGDRDFRVRRLELLRGQLATAPEDELRQRETVFLRYTGHGVFLTLQNPFGQWKRQGERFSLAYPPDMTWQPRTNAFVSDRLCIGVCTPSGTTFPARLLPEWKLAPADTLARGPRIDVAEVDAAVGCSRAFLSYHPAVPERVMVGWCVNDYQIDISQPEGRTEYKRIIDQVAAIGGKRVLFDPANSVDAPLDQNRDAWGWENLLWFTMGQKVRKDEWDPANDTLPISVQEMVDYAKAKDIRFLAYVYPSLPFMQQKEWTGWVPNGNLGGYLGADTGQRSFQDWLIEKLVGFQRNTGAGGFSFDHWWIAYDETPSSKYAQWAGCRRILQELRCQIPDVVMDGRQQYHGFGVWTWLAGSYPHPLVSDEQPESFPAFPDLHWSRVSADRQRRSSWYYRQGCFAPVEIMPGYMTHQTPRNDAQGVCRRDRFRPADWDLLGWKYSVISAIASAPYHLIVNCIPARDEREFKAFSSADQQWFRNWFDWTEHNIGVLRNVKPIIGAPQVGRADGWAAFGGERGFVFLFNPNYRAVTAEFALDQTIGLKDGKRFVFTQLYPDAQAGRLVGPPGKVHWQRGDKVRMPMTGTEAVVLEVAPAPDSIEHPWLAGSVGQAALNGTRLELTGVRGEMGAEQELVIALPANASVTVLQVNGIKTAFRQDGPQVTAEVRFAGAPFTARQQLGTVRPEFADATFKAEVAIPARVFKQLEARKQSWPVDYSPEERAAVWLNSDRLLLYINVAEPNDENMSDPTLRVDGEVVPVTRAYTAIVRSNPRHTFTGWYADVSLLKPDVKHQFEVSLPKLAPGQFQGLFFDTIEPEYTSEVLTSN
jgi:hypothetical protein